MNVAFTRAWGIQRRGVFSSFLGGQRQGCHGGILLESPGAFFFLMVTDVVRSNTTSTVIS